jgi:hypothetical protein
MATRVKLSRRGRATRIARAAGYPAEAVAWLEKNPKALRFIEDAAKRNAKWDRIAVLTTDLDRSESPPAAPPRRQRPRGRLSSASRGARLIAKSEEVTESERRHVERAQHDQLTAALLDAVYDFYTSLRRNVPRSALEAVLARIREYENREYDEKDEHPLEHTPLLRAAKNIGRRVGTFLHLRAERGAPPARKMTRLLGTRIRILCGGLLMRTWGETATRTGSGTPRKTGSRPETTSRKLGEAVDLLAPSLLNILYSSAPAPARRAALAFTGRLVGRGVEGVRDAAERAASANAR